jgi:hypothetical protein
VESITHVYNAFELKDQLSLSQFRLLVSGKKDSAVPNVRKWIHETDKCQLCPQRKTAIMVLTKLLPPVEGKAGESLATHFMN